MRIVPTEPGLHRLLARRIIAQSPNAPLRLYARLQVAASNTERIADVLARVADALGPEDDGAPEIHRTIGRLRAAAAEMRAAPPTEAPGGLLLDSVLHDLFEANDLLHRAVRDKLPAAGRQPG